MSSEILLRQAAEMLAAEPWYVAAMSNLSALIFSSLPGLNWAGFYIFRNDGLIVGPFQGKPACIHIPPGKGVCGTAVLEDRMQVVPNVHQFPGHIACDAVSRSEIVVPIHHEGKIAAVIDLDSPQYDRFTAADADLISQLVELMERYLSWN